MRQRSAHGIGLALLSLLAGCSGTETVVDTGSEAVESRGLVPMQRPMKPGMPGQSVVPAQPGAPGQLNAQLPTFPQKFDVQGPEVDSFGFAVTQPGRECPG